MEKGVKVLIADDESVSRRKLGLILEKLGYHPLIADDGLEAWHIWQQERPQIVITDWLMPGLEGSELCRRIRKTENGAYTYIILVTSRDSSEDVVRGMSSGADDYITKPFFKEELKVRIKAGERIVRLEKALADKNKHLRSSNQQLAQLYQNLKKDLEAAATVQKSLLPNPAVLGDCLRFDWIFLPSAIVAGDIFNYFRLDDRHIVLYVLDVMGHGVAAAMLSVTLTRILSPTDNQYNLLTGAQNESLKSPKQIINALNHHFQSPPRNIQFFTIFYGVYDIEEHRLTYTLAGQPHPILIKKGQAPQLIGQNGFLVGALPEADYEEHEITLTPGERIIIYSDGVSECDTPDRRQFSTERLLSTLEAGKHKPLVDQLRGVEAALCKWHTSAEFDDDLTLLGLERI